MNYKYRVLGIIGIIFSITLVYFYSNFILIFISFIEEHISHDGHVEPEGIDNIKKLLSTIIIVIAGLSILLVFNAFKKLLEITGAFINVEKVKKTFLTNNLTTKQNVQPRLFVAGTFFGFLLPFLLPIFNEPKSEGIIEEASSGLFLAAGLLLLRSTVQINKIHFTPAVIKKVKIILITISIFFIVMFGEEISWGQRIFGWESEGVFKEYNFQSETNFHNFFNPIFDIFYAILGLGLFLSLFFLWFFPKENRNFLWQLFCPHVSNFFIIFIMACLTFNGHSEIFEELLAIFCVLYSIRIFYSLKFPRKTL